MGAKIKVGILGATGMVGQRFIQLLADHPWFEIAALGASERSANQTYKAATKHWKQVTPIPENVADIIIQTCEAPLFVKAGCRLVFSGLDSSVAGPIEIEMAKSGIAVFSNSKNHRMDDLVPLVVPTVNADHLDVVKEQQKQLGYEGGFIVCNANCSSTGLCVPLKALDDAFGLESVMVTTLQAVSGSGYPGCASIDMLDNVVPYIGDEEPKLEEEPRKILGGWGAGKWAYKDLNVSASCNRVAVIDGHTECVNVKLTKKPTVEEVKSAFATYESEANRLKLPSIKHKSIVVHEAPDRPQPRLDRDTGAGFTVSVGRVRECPVLDFKFVVLSHNTILGAAGGALMNAELAKHKGLLD